MHEQLCQVWEQRQSSTKLSRIAALYGRTPDCFISYVGAVILYLPGLEMQYSKWHVPFALPVRPPFLGPCRPTDADEILVPPPLPSAICAFVEATMLTRLCDMQVGCMPISTPGMSLTPSGASPCLPMPPGPTRQQGSSRSQTGSFANVTQRPEATLGLRSLEADRTPAQRRKSTSMIPLTLHRTLRTLEVQTAQTKEEVRSWLVEFHRAGREVQPTRAVLRPHLPMWLVRLPSLHLHSTTSRRTAGALQDRPSQTTLRGRAPSARQAAAWPGSARGLSAGGALL